jgi:hypothetical protein
MVQVDLSPTDGRQPAAPTPVSRYGSTRSRARVTSYDVGRVCLSPACETVLSRYNDRAWCWIHTGSGQSLSVPDIPVAPGRP